jgi:hypothetical protein
MLGAASHADVGTGSGKPITPYEPTENVTAARVTAARLEANGFAMLRGVRVVGSNASKSGYKVGFACAAGADVFEPPRFSFRGTDKDNVAREIQLADVRSFRLASIDTAVLGKSIALFDVTQFPTLSPEELIKRKPTYSALLAGSSRIVRLGVPLVCNAGELSMIGTSWTTETTYRQLFRLRDLRPGLDIDVSNTSKGDGHWWAIRSVTEDKKYPYRVVMKR